MLCNKVDHTYMEKIVTAVMPGVFDSLYIYFPFTLFFRLSGGRGERKDEILVRFIMMIVMMLSNDGHYF